MVSVSQDANLDRLSALIDAAASRADDRVVLFDFVLAIGDLWDRLGLRDPFVDAQLSDREARAQLARAARDGAAEATQEHEQLAFYALRTLAAFQTVIEGWRRRPSLRAAWAGR
ncbi:MAG TPA: hypothetical protein VJ650_17695 [Gemmatimonadaceae bacterium]|nr:hypothetical protein [Gemmatimonadaceae bacterium]